MLGTIDFDTEKSVLRSMIQNYNFSGAPVRIETSTTPTARKAARMP